MNFLRKNIGLLYIFLLAIQVVLIAHYCVSAMSLSFANYYYHQSVVLYFNEHKPLELFEYIFGVILLGLFFLTMMVGESKLNIKAKRNITISLLAYVNLRNKKNSLTIFFLLILLPIAIYFIGHSYKGKMAAQIIVFLISSVLPFWKYILCRTQIKNTIAVNRMRLFLVFINNLLQKKLFYLGFLLIGYLQLVHLFYDPVINNPKIINEYFNLQEITILADGKKVENKKYADEIIYHNNDLDQTSKLVGNLDNESLQWLKSNEYEIRWQNASRFMIHHHSFMFIPIADFSLDKNISTINAQYGLGSAWLFHKLLDAFDSVSLDGWLKASYLVYYGYFAIFIAVVYAITRSIAWTTIIFLLSLSVVNYRGYDFLLLPPGESPWRHFFDIVIVYLLFAYAHYKRVVFYAAALLFGVGSIVLNPQIGLMIFLAVFVSGVFYAYRERYRPKTTLLLSLIALPVAGTVFVLTSSANDLAGYYLDGVIGFPISFVQMLKIFTIIIIGYIFLWKIIKTGISKNYLYLIFLVIYTQELILYIVWHYDINGFKSRSFIYILTGALLIFPFRDILFYRWKNRIAKVLVLVTSIIYISSVISVLKSKYKYERIFQEHVTYEWNMERAKIISTMNPLCFQDGVNLIQKYSKGQNGIYIISEYDNFLPFLAHKYSLMPFFDLKWYLITPKELNKAIQTLKINKPEFLFVDSDIHRNLDNEILNQYIPVIGSYYQESVWRAERLKLLYSIYKNIDEEYKLVETSSLISVYKRIGSH